MTTAPYVDGPGTTPEPADAAASTPEVPSHRLGTDPRDLTSLYVNHRHELALLAHRYLRNPFDVDEVVQEAFLRMVLSMPELESELQAIAYARRTVTNLCLDRLRKEKRTPAQTPLDEMPVEVPSDDAALEDPILAAEDAALVRAALAKLAPTQRRALIAYEVEEKPVPEIAAELGIEETAVKHVLYRARRQLRKFLVGSYVDPEVDVLALAESEVWAIAARRAASGAQRVGVWLLLLALPALAAFGLWRGAMGGDTPTQIAEPPLQQPSALLGPAPVVPSTPAAVPGSSPTAGANAPVAPSATASLSPSATAATPAAPPAPPSRVPVSSSPERPAPASPAVPSPIPTDSQPAASPSVTGTPPPAPGSASPTSPPLPLPRGLTPLGIPVPDGFHVAIGGSVAVAGVFPLGGEQADLAQQLVAQTHVGVVTAFVRVTNPPSPAVDVSLDVPVRGRLVHLLPESVQVSKALVGRSNFVFVSAVLLLPTSGDDLGASSGPGLASVPSSGRLDLLLSPGMDRVVAASLQLMESTPAATVDPTPSASAPTAPTSAASAETTPAPTASSAAPPTPTDSAPSTGTAGSVAVPARLPLAESAPTGSPVP